MLLRHSAGGTRLLRRTDPKCLTFSLEICTRGHRRPCNTFPVINGTSSPLNDLQAAPQYSEEDAGIVLDEFIGPELQLMEQRIELAGRRISLIVPRSSDAVMDYYINAERWDRDPYWCRAWPSALALGQFISQKPELVRRKRICEIGAGLGIAGMAAAFAGASKVVLTDREPLALECSKRSFVASGIPASQQSQEVSDNQQVTSSLLDWTDPEPGIGTFDVLLACDVLYEASAVQPVAELVSKLMSHTGGKFILADPETRTEAHRKEFLKLLTESRLHPMSVEFSDVSDITMDSTRTAVRIIVLRSNLSGDTIGVKAI